MSSSDPELPAVEARWRDLLGDREVDRSGVVQVVAVWEAPDGAYHVLKVDPSSPQSSDDDFVLAACRARADAIVTTGAILRAEPGLCHDLPETLQAWRRGTLGRSAPAALLVLTSGAGLDPDHAALNGSASPIVFTSRGTADRLRSQLEGRAIEVVGRQQPSLATALAYLREERGARTLLVEAGPTTSRGLYRPPPSITELVLSVFHGQRPGLVEAPFPTQGRLRRLLPRHTSGGRRLQGGGEWSFHRFTGGV